MTGRVATPFDALLGLQSPVDLPRTGGVTLVVSGYRVTDPCEIDQLLDEDDPKRAQLREAIASRRYDTRYPSDRARREKARATQRAWYQANRETVVARSHAWYRAHREDVLAKKRAERAAERAAKSAASSITTDERKDA